MSLIPYIDTDKDIEKYKERLKDKMQSENINLNSNILQFPTLVNHCILWSKSIFTVYFTTFFYKLGIHGSAGMLELRGRNFLQFEVEVSSTVLPAYAEPTVIRPSVQRDNITMMLVPELEAFADAIYERCQPAITVADGQQVLRILDAVAESGRVGKPIALR